MIKFNLDKKVYLSSYDQIKGQLLSAIYCGKIQEGDRLPSIRELAEDLEVNYKTIRKVYQRLAQENYIELIQGSGAFLKKRSGDTYEQMQRRAVFKLLSEVTEKARSLGLSPQKFVKLLDGYCTGDNVKKLKLVVMDDEEEAFIFSKELEMRLKAEVSPVSLDGAKVNGTCSALNDVDYVLTTSWHMDQVRDLAQRHEKKVVEIKPSHEIYTEILNAARHRNVAVVIRDERTMHAPLEVFMNIYHPSTQKKFWIAPIDRRELIEEIIREAELIFVSPMCWDEMRRITPGDVELKTYSNFISEETINHLKELQLLG
ncbi:MAG: GntR family transcriptional regulator [Acidobacteriota bacterium]